MKLSWKVATLAALTAAAPNADAYASQCSTIRPSSALGMRPRGRMMSRRSPLATSRSLIAPTQIFKEMDELFDRQFDDFFDSPFLMRPMTPFLSRRADLMLPDVSLRRPYRYRITEDDDKFQLTVDVPGVKASDMNIQLEKDGRVLRISGTREVKNGEMSYESKFDKAFVLDRNVDTENIRASLAEGVMTIDAPKKAMEEKKVLAIPITEEVSTDGASADATEEIKNEEVSADAASAVTAKESEKEDVSAEDIIDLDSKADEIKPEDLNAHVKAELDAADIPEEQPKQENNDEA